MNNGRNRNVLVLGPKNLKVMEYLKSFGDAVVRTEAEISAGDPLLQEADIILSYGYRHIITSEIIDRFDRRIINLHISYLPYNRGADPNLWSYLEDTPRGVTIHFIDNGIDTGDIIAQCEVAGNDDDTLRTSYVRLKSEIEKLLKQVWPEIRSGIAAASPQIGEGSLHRLKDKRPYEHLLSAGWDTPVAELIGKALSQISKETD